MTFDQQLRDYRAALKWVAELMASTPSDSLGRPTPCTEFDVRTLMGHLIGTAERGLRTAKRHGHRRVPHVVTGIPDHELAGTYAALVASIGSAWGQLTGDEPVMAPWGECTALEAARGFTVETVTHGWDLAVATGRPGHAPAGVAERCLLFAEAVVPDRLRGVMYDNPVPAGGTASATEQLARLLGRKHP